MGKPPRTFPDLKATTFHNENQENPLRPPELQRCSSDRFRVSRTKKKLRSVCAVATDRVEKSVCKLAQTRVEWVVELPERMRGHSLVGSPYKQVSKVCFLVSHFRQTLIPVFQKIYASLHKSMQACIDFLVGPGALQMSLSDNPPSLAPSLDRFTKPGVLF